jgi:hypothetical protein
LRKWFGFGRKTELEGAGSLPEPEANGGVPALLDYVFASSKMEGEIVGKDICGNKAYRLREEARDPAHVTAVFQTACLVAYGVAHIFASRKSKAELVQMISDRARVEIPDYGALEHRAAVYTNTEMRKRGSVIPKDFHRYVAEWVLAQEILVPGQDCSKLIKLLAKHLFSVSWDCLRVERRCGVVARDMDEGEPSAV